MSIVENIIRWVSPKLALDRARHLAALEVLRGYEAASRGKRARNWGTTSGSAETDILPYQTAITARARDMVRNNGYVRKAARVVRTSVVGTGIRVSIRSTRSAVATRTMKALWKAWAETNACDFHGRKNFYGIQRQIMHAVYVDGETFVRMRRTDNPSGIPLQLQVMETDYLDTTKANVNLEGGGRITGGIETDSDGRKVAYWLFSNHPHDLYGLTNAVSQRVPATDILHIYSEERAGQLRGVSELASTLFRLKDYDEYEDAQLIRQKIAACFSVFVHGEGEARPGDDADGFALERVEPGMIEYLSPGKNVTFGTPPVTENYAEYGRGVLQGAAAGAGLTYESMTGDLSNVNFSSGRMGWIEMNRFVKEWQDDVMIMQVTSPIWQWFEKVCKITGKIPASAVFETSWTAPRREMIDPVKETKGLEASIRANLVSWQDTVRELGGDPEVLEEEIREDMARFDSLGAKPTVDPRYDPQRQQAQQVQQNE